MKLAEFMEQHGLILKEVAKAAGLSISHVSAIRVERKGVKVSPGVCLAIEDYTRRIATERLDHSPIPKEFVMATDLPLSHDLRSLLEREHARARETT